MLLLVCGLLGGIASAQQAGAQPRLGINIAGLADWNTELPLVDVFRLSRLWVSQQQGGRWRTGPALDLDEHGWVRSLRPGCWADTLLCTIRGGHYPSGRYVVLYRGRGKIEFWGAARVVSREPGRMVIEVDSKKSPIGLRLREVDPSDYIRDIHVIMPGREDSWRSAPWNPSFLKRWQGFACLRFMDLMKTNGSTVRRWSDRPKLDDATWTTRGMPVEMLCDLANRLDTDPWFFMPHMADDDYVRFFARLVKERLAPRRKVYVEYSNELWNNIFAQHRWAAEQGRKLGLAEKPWAAAWKYAGYRSKQIFRIWEQVFGGTDRLVRVLASQAVNPYAARQVLQSDEAWKRADALAIAPYFGLRVRGDEAAQMATLAVDAILDRVERESLPRAIAAIKENKAVADRFGLTLVAYEAGQSLVGVRGGENNDQLTRLFQEANRHVRMGQCYRRYYDAWAQARGDLMCVFSSVSRWSKWGSWGLMQYADERPADYPKFLETLKWAKAHGQHVSGL